MQESHHHLDAIQDPRHPSYRVPGLLAWFVLGLGLAGTWFFPRFFVAAAQVFALFLAARLLVTVLCYLFGLGRCHLWETRGRPGEGQGADRLDRDKIHHVVLIPNYREPVEILSRTLERLAEQEEANHRVTVVLAMEEREPGAYDKATALRDLYADRFAHVLITVHPADRPGAVAGKGSNQAWAACQTRQELVDRLGLSLEHLTLTSCDADSVLHPRYFADLARLFADDPNRHRRFWHAPVFCRNNIWQVPGLIRQLSFAVGASRLAELAGPLSLPLPESTYTLSFKLADEVGYWDPAVISEDWHIYLRCFFATQGQVKLKRIFLPFSCDAVNAETFWETVASFYRQKMRHAWGAQDVGYILQQWRRSPGVPFIKKCLCLGRVATFHLLWSTSWFLIAQGWLVSIRLRVFPGEPIGADTIFPEPFRYFGLVWTLGAAVIWMIERIGSRPGWQGWRLTTLASELVVWVAWPFIALGLLALPALHAQTKMLLGSEMAYRRTPKRLATRVSVRQHLLEK